MKFRGKIVFILIMAALQVICYFAFTVSGFMRIYNYALERSLYYAGDDRGDEEHLSEMYGDCRGDMIFINRKADGNAINFEELWLNVLYLRKFYQVKYIVLDCGYSESMLLNDYIDLKNRPAISRLISGFQSDELRSVEFAGIVEKIIELNDESNESKKLRFLGIAPETDASAVKRYIKKILNRSANRVPAAEIQSALTQGTRTDKAYIINLTKSVDKFPNLYRQILIENFYEFRYVLNCFEPTPDPEGIQKKSAENFAEYIARNTQAKCFIQYSDPTLIMRIYELRPDLKNRCASYSVKYMNCAGVEQNSALAFSVATEAKVSDGQQRIIFWNDRYIKWLEGYRRFVYKLNGRKSGRYSVDNNSGGLFMLLCDSKPLEEYVPANEYPDIK